LQLAAEFGTGQVLWSILWFFLFFVWIMLIFTIFGDIIRNHEMSGGAKALWSIFIIFVPFLGIFIYLIVNGGKMGERQVAAAKAQEAAMQDYIRTTASSGGSAADQLSTLAELHSSGKLDDAEYATAKAKVIGS
jgi:Phospholipase_D-nuclease N-terminal